MKENIVVATMAERIIGKVMRRNTVSGLAPRLAATSSARAIETLQARNDEANRPGNGEQNVGCDQSLG